MNSEHVKSVTINLSTWLHIRCFYLKCVYIKLGDFQQSILETAQISYFSGFSDTEANELLWNK